MSWEVEVKMDAAPDVKLSFQDRPTIGEGTIFVRITGGEGERWLRHDKISEMAIRPINPPETTGI